MLRTLTALPPRPARFPPERGWACNDVSCHMPVGLSLRTEAKCRLLLHTPNQPAYPHRPSAIVCAALLLFPRLLAFDYVLPLEAPLDRPLLPIICLLPHHVTPPIT